MISLPVQDMNGKKVGTYEFDPVELAPRINRQLLHDAVVMYENNSRAGTSQTRSRGQVKGSTRKLYRQKGTGRARAGSRRTPLRRGGGHTFAKVTKDWKYRLPKNAVRLATRMALLSKFQDEEVTLLAELALPEPKTRHVQAVLEKLKLAEISCLLTVAEHDPVIWRCSRNIAQLWVSPANDLNAFKLLHQKQLLITREALDRFRGIEAEQEPAAKPRKARAKKTTKADKADKATKGKKGSKKKAKKAIKKAARKSKQDD